MSYYLYTGGVLKRVEREKAQIKSTGEGPFKHWNGWLEYLNSLPSIQVSDDLKKSWKEGDRPVVGKDFQLKLLTYYQFMGSATTGCFAGCSRARIESGGCICYSKHEYAVSPTLSVNTLQEEKTDPEIVEAVKDFCNDMGKKEDSQDSLFLEVCMLLLDNEKNNISWQISKQQLKSEFHITRIKQQ